MMLLTREINEKLPAAVGKAADATTRVGCATCHRGVPIPKQLPDVITDAAATGGATAGLAKYKELREKFYGGQSYDFSENGLLTIAQRAIAASKPDDALAYLQANLEYYPKSSRTYQAMAQVKNGEGRQGRRDQGSREGRRARPEQRAGEDAARESQEIRNSEL